MGFYFALRKANLKDTDKQQQLTTTVWLKSTRHVHGGFSDLSSVLRCLIEIFLNILSAESNQRKLTSNYLMQNSKPALKIEVP